MNNNISPYLSVKNPDGQNKDFIVTHQGDRVVYRCPSWMSEGYAFINGVKFGEEVYWRESLRALRKLRLKVCFVGTASSADPTKYFSPIERGKKANKSNAIKQHHYLSKKTAKAFVDGFEWFKGEALDDYRVDWLNPQSDNMEHKRDYGCDSSPKKDYSLTGYQLESRQTHYFIDVNHPITYPVLGLVNEVGEFVGKVKKLFRDYRGELDRERKDNLKDELGDILWYYTQVCTELGFSLEEIAEANMKKLLDRQERGVIKGDGDKR